MTTVDVNGGSSCFYDLKAQFSDGYIQTAHVNACNGDYAIFN